MILGKVKYITVKAIPAIVRILKNTTFGFAAHTVSELESMIQSQNSLMEKLTGECRLLTDKLDDANRRHMYEIYQF